MLDLRHRLRKLERRLRRVERRAVRLEPAGSVRAQVLFSYVLDPLLDPRRADDRSHTHFWESACIAHTLVELGCAVDAIHWTNAGFTASRDYDLMIDVRGNLERLDAQLPERALRVLHCDTAHWAFNNAAELERLRALEARRGVRLAPRRQMEALGSDRLADRLTYLGNEFTRSTYPADKPMDRVPVSVPCHYDWPAERDLETVRRTFLWFGSGGLVHKGLDLVLEAFAELPEHRLLVCGPLGRERDFVRAYRRELHELPNVEALGWIDVERDLPRLARRCVGLVYPSCSEGGGASALSCLHAGLVPVLTREASVDLDPSWGIELPEASVAAVREAVLGLSEEPPARLEQRARGAWEWVRAHHSREQFASRFREVASTLLQAASDKAGR